MRVNALPEAEIVRTGVGGSSHEGEKFWLPLQLGLGQD